MGKPQREDKIECFGLSPETGSRRGGYSGEKATAHVLQQEAIPATVMVAGRGKGESLPEAASDSDVSGQRLKNVWWSDAPSLAFETWGTTNLSHPSG
jgi:hypothetical protein